MNLKPLTPKQWILLILAIISLIPVILALITSVTQPQVQANLQLYQTNLILQASEFPTEQLDKGVNIDPSSIEKAQKALLGKDPYATAITQYQEARELTQKNIQLLKKEQLKFLPTSAQNKYVKKGNIEQSLYEARNFIKQIDLELGILNAQQGKTQEALQIWQNLLEQPKRKLLATKPKILKTATFLKGLWSEPPEALPDAESQIKRTLNGWFRYTALKRLYRIENRQEDLAALQVKEAQIASQALLKLTIVSVVPLLCGLIGVCILLFLFAQLLIKPDRSLLNINKELAWEIKWDLETILQVFIVGFFFIGQILLPILFSVLWGSLSINPTEFSLRFKAAYVLVSYLAIAVGGLTVLYISLKPFLPLPEDWFQFKGWSNWIIWGLGGYFVALPLVIVISLINQQIWQGQGGSNPLLFLALESQDRIALAIFFITASIAAPVFEEILFRGFLLPSLTRYLPVWGAIVVSSLIFALAHLNLSEVLPLATLGIILGVVYTRSRNLLSSILLHSLWNSGTLISLFVLGSSTGS